jgi:hypothetical protein
MLASCGDIEWAVNKRHLWNQKKQALEKPETASSVEGLKSRIFKKKLGLRTKAFYKIILRKNYYHKLVLPLS